MGKKLNPSSPAEDFPGVWESSAHDELKFEFEIDGNVISVSNSNAEAVVNKHVFLAVNEYVKDATAFFWLTDQDGKAPYQAKIAFSTECASDVHGNPQFVYFDLEEICRFEEDGDLEEARAKLAVLERCVEAGRAAVAKLEKEEEK